MISTVLKQCDIRKHYSKAKALSNFLTLFSFFSSTQAAALAASNSSKASLTFICIKLTTVMGLTWILQLAANWRHTEFLQYPSAVLNSMQGKRAGLSYLD